MRPFTKLALVLGLVVLVSAMAVSPSQAQRRRGGTHIFVGGYFGYPFYGAYYDPFFYPGYYPWGAYYWQGYPPDGDAGRREQTIGVRTDISPKETQIYIDGYFRGTASDFDGMFKRLRVTPGQHEVILYLKGYKTVRESLDLKPGSDYRLKEKMAPLAAGEANEPPPSAPPQSQPVAGAPREMPPGQQPSPDEPRRHAPRQRAVAPAEARGFGAIAIRVQPPGAEVLIDGERWQGPEGPGPLIVQVAEGPHRVEIRKEGYVGYSADVQVREGETQPLNISLPRQ
jgi:hypothetical protein